MLRVLYLLLAFAFLASGTAARGDYVFRASNVSTIQSVYDFASKTHEYSVLIVEPASTLPGYEPKPSDIRQSEILSERVKSWVATQYVGRYPNESADDLRTMVAADDFIDGTSSWLVVTDRRDSTRIHATMRFAWKGPTRTKLPLEDYLGVELLPEKVDYGEYPLSIELWKPDVKLGFLDTYDYERVSVLSGRVKKKTVRRKRLSGAVVEIKNFIVGKDAPEDLVPLLFYLSEKTEIAYRNSNRPLVDLLGLKGLEHVAAETLITRWGTRSDSFHPSRYVLYAKSPLDVYYRSLGFERYPVQPHGTGNTIFHMDREKYARSIGDRFSRRPGYQTLVEGNLERVPLAHLWQGDIRGIPSVFSLDCRQLFQ